MFGTTLLVEGKEAMLADRAVDERVAEARREVPDVEVTRVTGPELAGTNQFAEITGASLFASHRAVVISDLANFPTELADLLVATATDPGEGLSLTLVHGGGVKGKKILDALKKVGVERFVAEPIKPWKIGEFVVAEARRNRVRMDQGAVQGLVDAVGTDLRSLAAAVAQLASDWPDEPVTSDIVARYFAGRVEITSFQVADDVMAARPGEALVKLRWARAANVSPPAITSAIASQLRTLGRYFGVRGLRMSPREMAAQIGVQEWKLKPLPDQARRWSPAGVARALVVVAQADADVKGAASDPDFALEQMLLRVEAARRS